MDIGDNAPVTPDQPPASLRSDQVELMVTYILSLVPQWNYEPWRARDYNGFREEAYPVTRALELQFSAVDPLGQDPPDSGDAVLGGSWESGDLWGGIEEGMIKLAPYGPAVPDDVKQLAEAKAARLASASTGGA